MSDTFWTGIKPKEVKALVKHHKSFRNIIGGSRMTVILPDVKVDLVGSDGNAFAVIGKVTRAMKKAGHADRVKEFMAEATAGDYDHLLGTCMKWVDVS